MTKKDALDLSIELWEWMARTGAELKEDWPGFEDIREDDMPVYECFMCEYASGKGGCEDCPYFQDHAHRCYIFEWEVCTQGHYAPFDEWEEARTIEERKIHAAAFLVELREVRANI